MDEELKKIEDKLKRFTVSLEAATDAVNSLSLTPIGDLVLDLSQITPSIGTFGQSIDTVRSALDQAAKSVVAIPEAAPILNTQLEEAGRALNPEEAASRAVMFQPGTYSKQEEVLSLRAKFDNDFSKFVKFFADQEMNVVQNLGNRPEDFRENKLQNIPPQVLERAYRIWTDVGEKLEKKIETTSVINQPAPPAKPPGGPATPPPPIKPPSQPPSQPPAPKNNNNLTNIYIFEQLKSILGRIADTVSEFQATALSRGFDKPMSVLNNSLSNNIPAMTELKVSTTLLKTGLERNSSRIAEYIARSELLGENSFQLANSIRSFSTTMGLNATEQGAFVKSVADAAATYKASTEELATSIASFVDQIGLVTITGDQTTIEAFKTLEARIGRSLPPGTLERTVSQILKQDVGAIGAASFLGVQEERATIADISGRTTSDQKVNAILSFVEKTAAKGAEFGAVAGDVNILRSITGGVMAPLGGPDLFVQARMISDAANRAPTPEEEREASLADATTALIKLGDRLLEPLALAGQSLLAILQALDKFSSGLTSILLGSLVAGAFASMVRGITKLVSLVPAALNQANNFLRQIMINTAAGGGGGQSLSIARQNRGILSRANQRQGVGAKIKTTGRLAKRLATRSVAKVGVARTVGAIGATAVGGLLGAFGGIPGVIITALSFLPMIYDSVFGTKENTGEINKKTKALPTNNISDARTSLINQASLISQVSNETIRTSILMSKTDRDDISYQHAQLQLERLGQIVDRLKDIRDKRPEVPDMLTRKS